MYAQIPSPWLDPQTKMAFPTFVAHSQDNMVSLQNILLSHLGEKLYSLSVFLVYVENGRSTASSTMTFTIATTTGVTWNMRVTQIPCYADYK